MTRQSRLFEAPQTTKNPVCPYVKPCGHLAEIVSVQARDGCVTTEVRCMQCKARGVISERKDQCLPGPSVRSVTKVERLA